MNKAKTLCFTAMLFLVACSNAKKEDTPVKQEAQVKQETPKKVKVEVKKESLYTQLGGQGAINAAVDLFYVKVLADKRVNHFFEDINMRRQVKRQKEFLGSALGGPIKYTGRSLERAHKGLNLTAEHFGAIAGHLQTTLQELKIAPQVVAEVIAVVASQKDKIINR